MFIVLLIAVLGIAGTLSQDSYGSDSFSYWGCASVDPRGFGEPIVFPAGQLTPEACQTACEGQMFAAVSPDTCRCGDNPNAIISVDEGSCDYPCTKEPNSPMCGGICPDETPSISNVFVISPGLMSNQDQIPEGDDPGGPSTANDLQPPTIVQTTATASQGPSIEPSQGPPVAPIPQDPTPTLPTPPGNTLQVPPEISAPDSLSAPEPSSQLSTGLPVGDQSPILSTQTLSVASTALTSLLGDRPSLTLEMPNSPSVFQTPSSAIPTFSEGTNLTDPPGSTLWPEPSTTPETDDDPPVPSQITVSGSSRFDLPVLVDLRGIIFIAAMII
ncbi:hypothetical protein EDB80DRAFT_871273 [Ilyonectria destructans]|nr:hypothetical protein EDB80DRAFT_871273 [Ilyonectria destructans]